MTGPVFCSSFPPPPPLFRLLLLPVQTQGLCWVLDDAFLKGTGPRAEGVPDDEGADDFRPDSPDSLVGSDPVTPALYVSPTSGQLSPGEESRIRLTFTPKRAGALTFALPVWLARVPAKDTRPYLTLMVKVTVATRHTDALSPS